MKLTIEDYKKIGRKLKQINKDLVEIYMEVAIKSGKSKKHSRNLERALRYLNQAKSDLENEMFEGNTVS